AAFFQGVTLGAYIDGIAITDRVFTGGAFDWLAPFPLFTGLGVIIAYALLGSCWLIWKTEGDLQKRMIELTKPLTWLLLAAIAVISIWTPLAHPHIAERWFVLPNILWFSPVPVLVGVTMLLLLRALKRGSDLAPFLYALCLIFLGYIGLAISLWPNVIPPNISIWDAAAPPQSQLFALVGTLIIIPVILAYTVWAYYVFRGKVRAEDGYH
ncbi:MAG TPA: cytochrome d ubiquinol oxidase subunit II, partial [Methylophilaceae bacterium]|nr:cytochrome d ubiquinol oxidase subunit II [Methylophilaceae bacterium]